MKNSVGLGVLELGDPCLKSPEKLEDLQSTPLPARMDE